MGCLYSVKVTEENAVTLARHGEWKDVLRLDNLTSISDPDGCNLLHVAASANRIDIVEILLQKGIGIDATDSQGHTALGFASGNGNGEIVSMLLEANADPYRKDMHGHSPIWAANDRGFQNIVDMLEK